MSKEFKGFEKYGRKWYIREDCNIEMIPDDWNKERFEYMKNIGNVFESYEKAVKISGDIREVYFGSKYTITKINDIKKDPANEFYGFRNLIDEYFKDEKRKKKKIENRLKIVSGLFNGMPINTLQWLTSDDDEIKDWCVEKVTKMHFSRGNEISQNELINEANSLFEYLTK